MMMGTAEVAMIAAAVDIGTNSVKLVIGRRDGTGAVQTLKDKVVTTRLGKGVDKTGRLDPDAVERTLEALRSFADNTKALGATKIAAVGTSALRDAANGPRFVQEVERILNGVVEVITGDREASLIYQAARQDPQISRLTQGVENIAVMDIGGGSTEFVLGSGGEVVFRDSLQLGAVRLTERALPADPPTEDELRNAAHHASEILVAVPRPIGATMVVGSGGTIANLVAMEKSDADPSFMMTPDSVHAVPLSLREIERRILSLASLPLASRRCVAGLEPDRADVIIAGAIIQAEALKRLGAETVLASARGLRYGLLYELLTDA
jgi:exopolyphosphatase/guanosine-5'-triphosphate,3'-diphosphate pyrophosphatase